MEIMKKDKISKLLKMVDEKTINLEEAKKALDKIEENSEAKVIFVKNNSEMEKTIEKVENISKEVMGKTKKLKDNTVIGTKYLKGRLIPVIEKATISTLEKVSNGATSMSTKIKKRSNKYIIDKNMKK